MHRLMALSMVCGSMSLAPWWRRWGAAAHPSGTPSAAPLPASLFLASARNARPALIAIGSCDGGRPAAGNFACVDRDEPAVHGRIVAVRAHGPCNATRVRRMAVDSGRSVPRAANPGRPDMEVARANETAVRAVVVFVGRAM